MNSGSTLKAKATEVLGIVLVLTGFIPVVLFALGSLIPAAEASAMLGLLPTLPSGWLSTAETWLRAHKILWAPQAGLVFAIPGVLVMVLGAAIAKRQVPVRDAIHARHEDARRRVRLYRGETERLEPTLGPSISTD
ncbi:MAG: hypothetical protein QOD26_93 [Betaproteobacteria bacterium]|jgi:hypothetical protein|nr:hypothetical protein [Betaproteobacteria bacterium]